MEARPYPPSDRKLEALRREGIFPLSAAVVSGGVLVGFSGAVLLFLSVGAAPLIGFFRRAFTAALGIESFRYVFYLVGEMIGLWLRLSALLVIGPVLFGAVAILFQTRFRFRFRRPRRASLDRDGRLRIGRFIRGLFLFGLWIAVGGVGLGLFFSGVLHLEWREGIAAEVTRLTHSAAYLGETPFDNPVVPALLGAATPWWLLTLVFVIVVTVVARVEAVHAFRRRFGMSREELEGELRETEVRPEYRARQREMSQD